MFTKMSFGIVVLAALAAGTFGLSSTGTTAKSGCCSKSGTCNSKAACCENCPECPCDKECCKDCTNGCECPCGAHDQSAVGEVNVE